MVTGDGLLVRLAPLARGFSPESLIGLCEAALRYGNGLLEVTSRGSLQIRGLTDDSAAALARDAAALDIAIRLGVPVETGPLAGLDPRETADPLSLASRIRRAIEDAGLQERLGPKVSVVVDGGGRSCLAGVLADVRLTAARRNSLVLWSLAVGGDAQTAANLAILPDEAAVRATLVVLEAVACLGMQARSRDLDTSRMQQVARSMQASHSDPEPFPAAGEMLPPSVVALREGRAALAVALPFGHAEGATLIAFAETAERLGISEVRLAPQRTIVALCPSEEAADGLRKEAVRLAFIVSPEDPRRCIVACAGAPACTSGKLPARSLAGEIAAGHGDIFDGSLELHVSGCAKGCAHPGSAALTLVGYDGGTGLVVAGTPRGEPVARTAADDTLAAFGRVARLLREDRGPGAAVSAKISRLGATRLAAAFEEG
jgi:precorrin-3B synthase